MGSGSSSSVKAIQIQQGKKDSLPERRPTDEGQVKSKKTKVSTKLEESSDEKTAVEADKTDFDSGQNGSVETVDSLEKKLIESESQRLDLEDRVQTLEERLEYLNSQADIKDQNSDFTETLHAKDQNITSLEQEKNELQQEIKKLKMRNRKRVKKMTSEMSEYKQETNFQMMELREEINRLKKNNTELRAKTSSGADGDSESQEEDGRMKIILELSSQVSEQSDMILKLEDTIKHKDLFIDELRVKLKNHTLYMQAQTEHPKSSTALTKKSQDSSVKQTSSDTNSKQSRKQSNQISPVVAQNKSDFGNYSSLKQSRINALFSVSELEEEEEEFEEPGNLSKLSSLLQGCKAPQDKDLGSPLNTPKQTSQDTVEILKALPDSSKQSWDMLEASRVRADLSKQSSLNTLEAFRAKIDSSKQSSADPLEVLRARAQPKEGRTSSGGSRDSGFGSAGKRDITDASKDNQISETKDRPSSAVSLESGGLSDSDLDMTYATNHSKISSAPPKMQNNHSNLKSNSGMDSRGRRSKKKSGLGKKLGKADGRPKPSLAFGENSETDEDGSFFLTEAVTVGKPIYA